MLRIVPIGFLALVLTGIASAQTQKLPPDIAALPDQIKTLKWQDVDLSSVQTLEHCRALLFMNHVLDEVSANATAEADLMSGYIEKQNLGSQFANTPPPPPSKQLSFEDAQKVAVAMLRGPMSQSYYATELGDSSAASLSSFEQMYLRTCQRKWSEFDESRHQVRCMASFLGNAGKLQDYNTWATVESAARQKQYDQHAGAPAAGQPAAPDQQSQALAAQNQQLQQALGAAEYQQQTQSQQTAQAQQQTADAQQQTAQAQQAAQQGDTAYVAAPVYGGYGAYGAGAYDAAAAGAAAGAAAANANSLQHPAAAGAAASQYHAQNSTWNRDSSYNSQARSQTDQRMSSFHGTSAARGGAGRR